MKDTIHVRKGEELDLPALQDYFNTLDLGEIQLYEQFHAGASNLTYVIHTNDTEIVLRRAPLGPVAPKAHDMTREYTILKSLAPQLLQVPKPIACEETGLVIGTPFFLMERKKGYMIDTKFPITYQEKYGENISEQMIDLLVALHAIPIEKTSLSQMTHPEGFLKRQVFGWIERYERAKTDDIDGIDTLMEWLIKNLPETNEYTLIHYDFKLNNVMFNEDFTKIIGLFDWEMTTIGDPLADVGVMLSYWITSADDSFLHHILGEKPVTTLPGFYTKEQMIQAYEKKSGRSLKDIRYYEIFAYFKLAVIGQQIYARYCKGQTKDSRFQYFGEIVKKLIQYALKQTNQ